MHSIPPESYVISLLMGIHYNIFGSTIVHAVCHFSKHYVAHDYAERKFNTEIIKYETSVFLLSSAQNIG